MILTGARVWNGTEFVTQDIHIDDNGMIADYSSGDTVDMSSFSIIPGFADTHIHGSFGSDVSDGDADAVCDMAYKLAYKGVTAFCPTTMTVSEETVMNAFEAVARAKEMLESSDIPHARILGVHLEGPFLSSSKAGVQGLQYLKTPKQGMDLVERIDSLYPGLLKIIDLAPELDGGLEFIERFKDRFFLSAAHTDCDYETAVSAFDKGLHSVTHVLNATTPIDKRAPGIACAAMDRDAYVEVICDGIHIQPPVLRMLYKMFGHDRIVVISDSMRGSGMPDGDYYLGDVKITCKGGRTYFGQNGNLAGSVTDMYSEFLTLTGIGIPFDAVLNSMTVNPYRRLNMKGGSITPGYPADLIVLDGCKIIAVFCCGRQLTI